MDSGSLRILAVHGIGNHQDDLGWQDEWTQTLAEILHSVDGRLADGAVEFVMHDAIFEQYPVSPADAVSAAWKLGWSAVTSPFRRPRFIGAVTHWMQWYAGMVVNWVDNDQLRAETRELLIAEIQRCRPDVICGHSLGSLICYDALTSPEGKQLMRGRTFISLGSQIGNPFVAGQFLGGKVLPLEEGHWYHLYNKYDRVFTAPINLQARNYEQVETTFRYGNNHGAVGYLKHDNTVESVWSALVARPMIRALAAEVRKDTKSIAAPRQRAVLVGINDYPAESMRLEGCANDVFEVSSALQECGFAAEEIRVVLDQRATKSEIMNRLRWLLDDAGPQDRLVFYFSGHGAQLPVYVPDGHVDHKVECLVPYDFDWSPEKSISDEDLFELYSQLPYETSLVILLDCCHSGGLTRDGARGVRGIAPPDDIRHRLLRWDRNFQMWVPRKLEPLHREMAEEDYGADYIGMTGDVMRIGAAMPLRSLSNAAFDRVTRERGHEGPYMPTILHACHEDEFAYEYRHGVSSYGAFTFALGKILREFNRERRIPISFRDLVDKAAEELSLLGYDQVPDIVGPESVIRSHVPWGEPAKSAKRSAPPRRTRRR